jgi:hypothetical protein
VEIGLELTGNPGISRRNPLERHYRDVLCSRIHSPQADTVLVGRRARGEGAVSLIVASQMEPEINAALAGLPLGPR